MYLDHTLQFKNATNKESFQAPSNSSLPFILLSLAMTRQRATDEGNTWWHQHRPSS